ncbi:hypothetical protein QE357_000374 [Siphonobacter sp. BAB-5404]|nr:hypothetical protein [Siphonobacter sp. SORGH_AS_0500]
MNSNIWEGSGNAATGTTLFFTDIIGRYASENYSIFAAS